MGNKEDKQHSDFLINEIKIFEQPKVNSFREGVEKMGSSIRDYHVWEKNDKIILFEHDAGLENISMYKIHRNADGTVDFLEEIGDLSISQMFAI